MNGRGRLPYLGNVGAVALSNAEKALAAGDKLGALRDFAKAYAAFRQSRAADASSKKSQALASMRPILADVGSEAFGPLLCAHGISKGLCCWACLDTVANRDDPVPPTDRNPGVASTQPSDLDVVFARRPRAENAEIIDAANAELAKKSGGSR